MRLPVLYMPDGGMAEDFLHVAGLVQVSVGNGTMRPFLLVGIENTQRRRDMTGPRRSRVTGRSRRGWAGRTRSAGSSAPS
jgi:enterochelin esterase-like enzyme